MNEQDNRMFIDLSEKRFTEEEILGKLLEKYVKKPSYDKEHASWFVPDKVSEQILKKWKKESLKKMKCQRGKG